MRNFPNHIMNIYINKYKCIQKIFIQVYYIRFGCVTIDCASSIFLLHLCYIINAQIHSPVYLLLYLKLETRSCGQADFH